MINIITGDADNNNFNELLNNFDLCKNKNDWEALIEVAKTKEPLTGRQREAIIERCTNQINGVYGKTKTDANLAHGRGK